MRKPWMACFALGLLACGNSTGPAPSWAGSWSFSVSNAAGFSTNPMPTVITLRDSAGKVLANMPNLSVVDSNNAIYLSWSGDGGLQSTAAAHDSLVLAVSGAVDGVIGYHWWLEIAGTRSGNSASGTVLLWAVENGAGSASSIATWTATKQ